MDEGSGSSPAATGAARPALRLRNRPLVAAHALRRNIGGRWHATPPWAPCVMKLTPRAGILGR